jgi:predicted nucleic acid-binding protein
VIVLDDSAAVAALLRDGSAREGAAREQLHATYVALADALGCALLTADARLARAPGTTCPVTVVAS